MTEHGRTRRRLLTVTYVVGAAILLSVAILLGTTSLQDSDAYAGIASALIALAGAFVAIVLYLRREKPPLKPEEAAEELVTALLEQWEPEIRHRRQRFGDSRIIPLTWAPADEKLADDPTAVIGAADSSVRLNDVRLKLEGRLDHNTDQAARKLALSFQQLPGSRRLVVLGDPGAGKTFLAITLAVGLLRQWSAGQPVPVFLSLSSWDPVVESLDDWMVRELASLYYGDRQRTPRTLLTMRRLLPVLDGLDELPEHVRRLAITRINNTLDGDRSLVLTCRTTEYLDDIAGGAPVLMRAAVVQVQPLSTKDVTAYLAGKPAWVDVVHQVRRQPGSPLAAALSTPLMLSLFTAAYRHRSPVELLENEKLNTRHAVEDHLVDVLLDTAYPEDSARGSWWSRQWTSKQARRWLTYLAQHLHEHNGRDLSSSQLAHRVIPSTITPGIGAGLIILVVILAPIVYRWVDSDPGNKDNSADVSSVPLLLLVIAGVMVASAVLAGLRLPPGRASLADNSRKENFALGMAIGTGCVLGAGAGTSLFSFLSRSDATTYDDVVRWSAQTCALIAMALVAGLGVGLHEILVARMHAKRGPRAGVSDFLRKDRSSALFAALLTALVVGALTFPFATIAAALGGHTGQRLALVFGLPTVVDLHLPPLETHVPWPLFPAGLTTIVTMSLLIAVIFGLAMLATRTWPRFLIARVMLAVFRMLPWRVVRFLADARERGVLRGAGGYYQFGHVRLQERLIATAVADKSKRSRRAWRIALVGLSAAVVLTTVTLVASEEPSSCRPTHWAGVDDRMTRTIEADDSVCLAYLAADEWSLLEKTSADSATLAKIGPARPPPDSASDAVDPDYVFVVGEFDILDPGEWHDVLEGLAAARAIHKPLIEVVFIYADFGSTGGVESIALMWRYIDLAIDRMGLQGLLRYRSTRAVLGVDLSKHALRDYKNFIGLSGVDMGSLVAEYRKTVIDDWIEYRSSSDGRAPLELADGVSAAECAAINARRTGDELTSDLRGVRDPLPLFERIAACGIVTLLVDEDVAKAARAQPERFSTLTFHAFEDTSATMERECRATLGDNSRSRVLATCVATLAAADSFRISIIGAGA